MKKNEIIVASLLGVVALSAAVVGFVKRDFVRKKFQQARKRIFGNQRNFSKPENESSETVTR